MLQNHLRIALLFLLSSSKSWAFSPSLLTPSSISSIKIHDNNGRDVTIQHMVNDDDDFYSDYDPSQYASLNQQTSYYGDDNSNSYEQRSRGNNQRRSFNNSSSNNFQYTRDTSRDNSNIDESMVYDLLAQRGEAKRNRDFDTADSIRDDLLLNHAVGIDDRERTWRTGCSASGSGMRFGGGGGNRRGDNRRGERGVRRERNFGPNGHDYEMSPGSGPNSSSLSEKEIHSLLAERLQAKMSRKFDIADTIQIDLINAGVYVHDGLKEWRGDGVPFGDLEGGRGPGKTRGSYSDRNRPYVKSAYSEEIEGVDGATIGKLVMERFKYKTLREYKKADLVREGLRDKFNVIIDDKLREWSVGGSFGEEHDKLREMAEQFANRGFSRSASSLPPNSETDEEEIQNLVDERTQLKAERKYDEADAIREDLNYRFDVVINDKLKEWSIGGAFGGNSKYRQYVKSSSSEPISEADEKIIVQALSKRSQLKAKRDYEGADAVRDELRSNFNVFIDDREREWRVQGRSQANYVADEDDDIDFEDSFDEEMKRFESSLSKETSDDTSDDEEILEDELEDDETDDIEDEDEERALLSHDILVEDVDNEGSDEGVPSEEELLALTVVQLKDKLRANGLPVSGNKTQLVERLMTAM